jgi:formylglycine-generating enzyme required for sulfatase activity
MKQKISLAVVMILAGCLFEPSLSTAQQQRGQTVQPKAIQRTALVIGNSNYGQGPLRNPANDARAMGNTLKDLGFEVTLKFNLNLRQMDEAVRAFGQKIKDGGIGLFYFAGHGVQVEGVNYLAPVGLRVEKEQDVKFEMLDIGKVTAEMEAAKNGLNILVLDACRNNPFLRAFRSPNPGLAPINAPSGTYIAFATAPGTTASDGEGNNGLYTQELLTNLKQPGLRLEDVFIRTRVSVKKKSNDLQVPWENGALEGVVILNGKAAANNGKAAANNGKAAANNGKAAANTTAGAVVVLPKFPKIRSSGIPLSTLRSGKFTTARVDEKGQVSKREAGPASFYLEDLGNGVKLEMVFIRGGKFQMGSPRTEPERDEDEIQHPVKVSGFWMGRYEVTQSQWIAVMGRLPRCLAVSDNLDRGDDIPLTCVTWNEVQEFIDKLNQLLKLDKERGYSLPREAEWEYAARGGTTTPFPYGETIAPGLENYDWGTSYANGPTQARNNQYLVKVGSFVANPFGLYDMLGNASEWCEDWLGEYPTASDGEQVDPTGPSEGERRVIRGGEYGSSARGCRVATRAGILPTYRPLISMGFRLVRRE